ncbi:SDR family NAD(P)-dependent oxidoreductase [Kiloniella laminariae]|uniref:SDR family NAD(P)-dependent oxidoreductase n=1 Tax=Kiloniella laminariae TaxID=454162 RepID=UPI00035DE39E|nr:glucose 1-dehydrogenase [Kiloniella laminariae]
MTALLENKIALVTGSSRGIGREIACLFAKENATVILHSLNEKNCQTTAEEIVAHGGKSPFIMAADISNPDEISRMFKEIFSVHKRLDILVNNAGILEDRLLGMITQDNLNKIFAVNTFGTLHCLQLAARLMRRSSNASVINLSSIIGVEGAAGQAAYAASKAAVIGLTKSAAKELGPQGIRVNAIAPGLIKTDMIAHLSLEQIADHIANTALQRLGSAQEIAQTVLFLASDQSSFITGQTLQVDGGLRV